MQGIIRLVVVAFGIRHEYTGVWYFPFHKLMHIPIGLRIPVLNICATIRLVEETEAHVLVGLLLLLLLGLLLGLLGRTTSSGSTASSRGSGTTGATGRDGGELRSTVGDELLCILATFPLQSPSFNSNNCRRRCVHIPR